MILKSSLGLGRLWISAFSVFVWAACATGSGSVANSGPPRIWGKVIGPEGEPLEEVRITTEPQTDAVLTFKGEYEITRFIETKKPVKAGRYRILANKLGWWLGKGKEAPQVEYPGGDFKVPAIRLVRIGGPELDELGAPEERREGEDSVPQGGSIKKDF